MSQFKLCATLIVDIMNISLVKNISAGSISFILFSGCSQIENEEFFTEVYDTKGEIYISSEKTIDPNLINILDDNIILGNSKAVPLIEIYDIKSREKTSEFLSKGNGPNEVLMAGNIQFVKSKDELLVADLFKGKLLKYSLKDIRSNDNPKPTIVFKLGDNSSLLFDKLFQGMGNIVAESRDPRGRILLLDEDGAEKGYYLTYPEKEKVDENLSDINNAKLYAGSITISPSLDKIAMATYTAGMIDICKLEKDNIVPIWSYNEFYPQGIEIMPMGETTAVAHTKKSRRGFASLSSSNKYIYALFSGKLFEDATNPYGEVIYVASWDGKETYKINVDKSINRLAVDINDEYIYGITSEMDIVRFPIPKR